jgi:hypothetical protein
MDLQMSPQPRVTVARPADPTGWPPQDQVPPPGAVEMGRGTAGEKHMWDVLGVRSRRPACLRYGRRRHPAPPPGAVEMGRGTAGSTGREGHQGEVHAHAGSFACMLVVVQRG